VLEFSDKKGHQAESKDGKPYFKFGLRDIHRRFALDYSLIDYFPDLPKLKQSEDQGCEFCVLLRQEIIQARYDYQGAVTIHLAYHWKNLHFREYGLSALVAEMEWHNQPPNTLANCIIFTVESNDGIPNNVSQDNANINRISQNVFHLGFNFQGSEITSLFAMKISSL
jgi:hypothetical protein